MKTIILSTWFALSTLQLLAQSNLRKETAINFYKDLIVRETNEDSIIVKYLYLQPTSVKSIRERNTYVKSILQEVRRSGRAIDTLQLEVLEYDKVEPIPNLKLDQNRDEDIFALVKSDKVLSYILFKNDKIESCIIIKKGDNMKYFLPF